MIHELDFMINYKLSGLRYSFINFKDVNELCYDKEYRYDESTDSRYYSRHIVDVDGVEGIWDFHEQWEDYALTQIDLEYDLAKMDMKGRLKDALSSLERTDTIQSLLVNFNDLKEKCNELNNIPYITPAIASSLRKKVEYLIAALMENQIEVERPSFRSTGQYSYPLKNINRRQGFVQDVFQELIDRKLISTDTKFASFIKVFQRQEEPIQVKIPWTGTQGELMYFIKAIYSNALIEATVNTGFKWQIATQCFRLVPEQEMDPYKLRGQKDPKDTSVIDNIIKLLKDALDIH